jgi:hypothetical protein
VIDNNVALAKSSALPRTARRAPAGSPPAPARHDLAFDVVSDDPQFSRRFYRHALERNPAAPDRQHGLFHAAVHHQRRRIASFSSRAPRRAGGALRS